MKGLSDYKIRIFICLVAIILGSIAIKRALYYGINNYSDDHKKFTELFRNNTYYDILLLGSSRMHNDINPAIVDSITGAKSFNAGTDAANILEMKMIFDAFLLAHPKPRLVVVNLDYFSLDIHNQYIGFYPKYLEFIDIPGIAALLKKNNVRVGVYKLFPFLETAEIDDYNRGNILKVLGHKSKIQAGDFYYQGFESNGSNVMHVGRRPCTESLSVRMDDEAKQALQQLISSCYAKGIRLIFTYAPEYMQNLQQCVANFGDVMNYYNSLASPYNIPFIRNDSLELNHNPLLFTNVGHLNRNGAEEYSVIIARQILQHGYSAK